MDILRKELNEIYAAQHLEAETLHAEGLSNARNRAETLALITGGCAVVTDAAADTCYIASGPFGRVMGYASEGNSRIEADSSDEDVIYSRLHPEDLVDKRLLEYEFFKFVSDLDSPAKLRYIAKCRIRMMDGSGTYRTVDNTTQIFSLSPGNKIWLILCTYNYGVDKDNESGICPQILNTATGESNFLSLGERRKAILTQREKSILILIREGKSSKMIADILNISIHTVNRHRQNIIEKLSVGNSVEAVTAAAQMGLL